MTGSRQIPVAEGLFTWPADEPRLIGARCTGCGLIGFPAGPACERCGGTEVSETFQPYALGYVELPGEVMVEARLTEPDPARLAIGQPMRLAIVPYTVRADGIEVLTFAFAPVAENAVDVPGEA